MRSQIGFFYFGTAAFLPHKKFCGTKRYDRDRRKKIQTALCLCASSADCIKGRIFREPEVSPFQVGGRYRNPQPPPPLSLALACLPSLFYLSPHVVKPSHHRTRIWAIYFAKHSPPPPPLCIKEKRAEVEQQEKLKHSSTFFRERECISRFAKWKRGEGFVNPGHKFMREGSDEKRA